MNGRKNSGFFHNARRRNAGPDQPAPPSARLVATDATALYVTADSADSSPRYSLHSFLFMATGTDVYAAEVRARRVAAHNTRRQDLLNYITLAAGGDRYVAACVIASATHLRI